MLRFSTKTPYIFKEPNKIIQYTDFAPKRIWAMYRHGTRLPGKKIISKYFGLIDIAEKLQFAKNLTVQEKELFKNWKPLNINLEHQKFLTKEGEEELFQLGDRFRKQFPQLINNESSFTFKYTPTQRTELSAKKFIEGLFQNDFFDYTLEEVARDDTILRPYKGCNLWRMNVKKNPRTLIEKNNLIKSQHVTAVINELREITQIDFLDFKDIELIYTICGFETAWRHHLYKEKSIWCLLFKNEEHLKIMEYLEDLEYFWVDGPAYEITRKVACKTVTNMIELLDPKNNFDKNMTFYFTHSGTILKLLTFLELYQDKSNLTAEKIDNERKWQTSQIDTFSTNIIAILYDSIRYGPHIQLLHQEKIINIPNCVMNEHGMCKFEDFKNLYKEKIKECNLTDICDNRKEEL
ncbi:hypothetical protein PVAND_013645 [Polypedilum vanderplanki]|uniref:2,3-bisphosphoglycerate 3-phosphatase n=1 Tax=Polypedilum vanderplanki TaxID=319348 RepID=A0A9J6CS83_POLVA|nr:hypothetical protein PVAND_013645 [Polypedilum vanderplanki]